MADSSESKRIFVSLNPKGGHAEPEALEHTLDQCFRQAGWSYDLHKIVDGEDLPAIVRQAVKDGYDICVAAGGDGTVSAVANGLVGTEVPLGIIPVGTGNGLARELGLPMPPEKACDLIAGNHAVTDVDSMKVGEQHFILNVSAGLSAMAMRDTSGESKHRLGRVAYLITGLRGLAGFQPRRFDLQIDGMHVVARASDVVVVNGSTPVKLLVSSGANHTLDDGEVGIYTIRARTILDYVALAWVLLWGLERRDRRIRVLHASQDISINTSRPVAVQADGESIGNTPVSISLVRKALRVIVPVPTGDDNPDLIERVRRLGG